MRTRIEFVDLKRQYAAVKDEVDAALLDVVASTQYILGTEVERFEREFAEFCEVEECVGVASGTAAIHLALEALEIGPGDEVIAPANTFIATVLPVLKLGARPILVDCDHVTATIDVEQAEAAITSRTKAIIAVHLYGHPANIDPLASLCEKHGVALVEDACQAHGARYKGRRVGGLGHIAAFSFYPGKNLGAYGDAGAVTTNSPELAEKVRLLRHLGQQEKYMHVLQGWNERLDTLQAAVLRVKLRHLDAWNDSRRAHAGRYAQLLADAGVVVPRSAAYVEHVWHLYVIRAPVGREELRKSFDAAEVSTGLHYPLPLHLQPALANLGYGESDFPVTESWSREMVSLPMFAELKDAEISRVAAVAKGWSVKAPSTATAARAAG